MNNIISNLEIRSKAVIASMHLITINFQVIKHLYIREIMMEV
jgi:hypothetical protein